ncbi:hypothetical protein [Rhodopirellula sp. SWK7]|uniref:hypothetical protein n=1 Tax=Rhodopirellula sp. SWK7 TaxID=595460 RepID=UPI0002BD91FD|nr:hypothetical protein [Rhodopirellula sp. SWK7]EMI47382.1 hypothetical protein RRSWK_00113 [Rhodopirellula sp. SWK7]
MTYSAHSAVINGTAIGAIISQSIDPGIQVQSDVAAGFVKPQYGEIVSANGIASLSSYDIAGLLAIVGVEGVCIGEDGFVLNFASWDACGAIASSGHIARSIAKGFVFPDTLTLQHGSRGNLSVRVAAFREGSNDPITTGVATLPTGATDELGYHLGPVTIAGLTFTRNTTVTINFGIEVEPEIDSGDTYPLSLRIKKIQPVIDVTTKDLTQFGDAAIPIGGVRATHANSSVVARKRVIGTGTYATGGSHLEMTFDGVAQIGTTEGSGNDAATMAARITTLDDKTNAMIVFDAEHDLNPA